MGFPTPEKVLKTFVVGIGVGSSDRFKARNVFGESIVGRGTIEASDAVRMLRGTVEIYNEDAREPLYIYWPGGHKEEWVL